MPDNFRDLRCTKVTVRHEVKVRLNFVRKVGAQIFGHGMVHTFALNLCLFVIRFLVGQVLRSRVKELPDQRFLPIGPCFRARPLAISQSEQHQRIQVFFVLHDVGQLHHRGRVIQISLLRNIGEGEVMIDQENERLALLG